MNTFSQPSADKMIESISHTAADANKRELHLICDEQCAVQTSTFPNSGDLCGEDILAATGRSVTADQIVLQLLHSGGLESIRLDERVNLTAGNKFVMANSDRTFRFTIDDKLYEWPYRLISGEIVGALLGNQPELEINLLGHGTTTPVLPKDLVDLSQPGVEKFVTRIKPHTWKLMLQGVVLEYEVPEVKVGEAMVRAGFDPNKAWHIYLIVQGKPKQEISADFIIDLRQPGIEKVRLMQRNVDNGDGQQTAPIRMFQLLAQDHQYLNALGLRWETVIEREAGGERRWLLIHDYALLDGYLPRIAQLALDIPKDYPAAQIDMFYFSPFVALSTEREIPSTQVRATIKGVTFQGWSRHRNTTSIWDSNSDSVRTHMALVESCLAKELGE